MGIHSWFGYLNENQCKHLHQLKQQVIHCVHSTSHSDTVECPCLYIIARAGGSSQIASKLELLRKQPQQSKAIALLNYYPNSIKTT